MKEGNVFYFDVDGTLLDNHSNQVSNKTIYALNALKRLNKAIVMCTGRSLSSIEELGYDRIVEWDGFVLSNGAHVLNRNKELIHEEYLDPDFVKLLTEESGGAVLLEGSEIFVSGILHPRLAHAYDYYKMDPYPFKAYENQRIYNAILYSYQESSAKLKESIGTHVKTTPQVPLHF